MFFVLSKILAFLLKPLNLMALTALYGLFTKIPQRRQRAFTILIIMLLGFSNPWIINELARHWEIGQRNYLFPPNITSTPALLPTFVETKNGCLLPKCHSPRVCSQPDAS